MSLRFLTVTFTAAFALLLSAPAHTGIPTPDQSAKQVRKQLNADLKSTLKGLNGQIKDARSELKSALKPITQTFKQGEATTADAEDLFDALLAFQSRMAAVATDAAAAYSAVFQGLGSLDPSDDSFAGEYPADFMPGAGGRFDKFLSDLDRALAKPYPSLRKQLAKLGTLAEKKSDLLIAARIEPVAGLFEQAVNNGAVTDGGRLPLTIDLAMSARDGENTRALWVTGSATNFGSDVVVALTGENSSTQDASFVSNVRYRRSFVGFNPGNYLFTARSDGDDMSVRLGIGLR